MTTIMQAAFAWKDAQANFTQTVGTAMMDEKDQLAAVIVEQQENEHKDSAGNALRQYSKLYKAHKASLGLSTETTLNLTGEFQQGITLRTDGENYEFESPATTDTGELKSDWLKRWNGSEIMLPTDENKAAMWGIIKPAVVENLAQQTGCGII